MAWKFAPGCPCCDAECENCWCSLPRTLYVEFSGCDLVGFLDSDCTNCEESLLGSNDCTGLRRHRVDFTECDPCDNGHGTILRYYGDLADPLDENCDNHLTKIYVEIACFTDNICGGADSNKQRWSFSVSIINDAGTSYVTWDCTPDVCAANGVCDGMKLGFFQAAGAPNCSRYDRHFTACDDFLFCCPPTSLTSWTADVFNNCIFNTLSVYVTDSP